MAYAVVQAAVTVALLVFAFAVRAEAPDISTIVVGATVGFWLKESVHLGRQAADRQHEARARRALGD